MFDQEQVEHIHIDIFRPTRPWFALWFRRISRASLCIYDTRLNAVLYAEHVIEMFPQMYVIVYSAERRWVQRVSGENCPLMVKAEEGN